MAEVTQEMIEQYTGLVRQAQQLMERIIEAERANRILTQMTDRTRNDFELFGLYIQHEYLRNVINGSDEIAVQALMVAVRAIFLYGYATGVQEQNDTRLTPLLGSVGKGGLQ